MTVISGMISFYQSEIEIKWILTWLHYKNTINKIIINFNRYIKAKNDITNGTFTYFFAYLWRAFFLFIIFMAVSDFLRLRCLLPIMDNLLEKWMDKFLKNWLFCARNFRGENWHRSDVRKRQRATDHACQAAALVHFVGI